MATQENANKRTKEKKVWSLQKVEWYSRLGYSWHKNLKLSNCLVVLFSVISLAIMLFTSLNDEYLLTTILKSLCANVSLITIILIILMCNHNAKYINTLILDTIDSKSYSEKKNKIYKKILDLLDISVLTLMIINIISLFIYINILIKVT